MTHRIREHTLSPAHLQAIGKVASEWAALEFSFQWAMVNVSQVPYDKVLAFTAPSPMNGWIDVLSNLLRLQSAAAEVPKELTELFERIRGVQRKRNEIVHAVWSRQFPKDWGKNRLYATDKAAGIGFPKKGKKTMVFYDYTAAEMRAVAKEILCLADEFREVFFPESKPTAKKHGTGNP